MAQRTTALFRLKLIQVGTAWADYLSRPSRARELKHNVPLTAEDYEVAPLAGA